MKTKLTIAVIAIFIIGAIWILVANKDVVDPVVQRGPMGGQMMASSTPTATIPAK